MKVCTCCYNPEVVTGTPYAGAFQNMVNVPDNTPVEGKGNTPFEQGWISHAVLEEAGLQWKWHVWCDPSGEVIMGTYDITCPEDPMQEPWARRILGDRALVIQFLKAHAANTSTLGSGLHMHRQAHVLLFLFDQYVLGGYQHQRDNEFNREGEFIGSYGQTRELDFAQLAPGFDIEGIQGIQLGLEADVQKLSALGVEPRSTDERALQYCYKLRRSLESNLRQLRMATSLTRTTYDLTDALGELGGVRLFLAVFASRHQTNQTASAVYLLYDAMLPILVAKLIEAGYPNCEEQAAWEYLPEENQ